MGQGQEAGDVRVVREFKPPPGRERFAALFGRYGRRLYASGFRMLHDAAAAEDCVQETFLRAIEHSQHLDENTEDSDLFRWLLVIARHVCLDEVRRIHTRDRHTGEVWAAYQRRVKPSPEKQAMLSELWDELSHLPPEYRRCYLLFQVDGYKYKEIMKITGNRYAQVKTYIQTARRHLERRFR